MFKNSLSRIVYTSALYILILPLFSFQVHASDNDALIAEISRLQILIVQLQEQLQLRMQTTVFADDLFPGMQDASNNGDISQLQRFLKSTGDFLYPEITGYYGPATEDAVGRYQLRHGIVSSTFTDGYGRMGPLTRAYVQSSGSGAYTPSQTVSDTATQEIVASTTTIGQDCSVHGLPIKNGASRKFYKYAYRDTLNKCQAQSEIRTCSNGQVSGSYERTTCSVFGDDVAVSGTKSDANDAEEAETPNILFIMLDDGGYADFTDPTIIKPNIERFATESTRFEQFYTNPACTPTRMSLLSGNWAAKYGIFWVKGYSSVYGVPNSSQTTPEVLADAGYQTATFGKWHAGSQRAEYAPTDNFQHSVITWSPSLHGYFDPEFTVNDEEAVAKTGEHMTDATADYLIEYLENQVDTDEPFFINYWLNAPHYPQEPSPRWAERYGNPTDKTTQYKALYSQADENIGRVLDVIDSDPYLKKNTIVMLVSDNGGEVTVHPDGNGELRGYKSEVFEGGIRLPLFVRWPGRTEAGVVNHSLINTNDILPTVADLTNTSLPNDVTGNSFADILEGNSTSLPKEKTLFWAHKTRLTTKVTDFLVNYAVRDKNWKLVHMPSERATSYLFNMDKSITELDSDDLSETYPNKLKELEGKYLDWLLSTTKISLEVDTMTDDVSQEGATFSFVDDGGFVTMENDLAFDVSTLNHTVSARITPEDRKDKKRVIARRDGTWKFFVNKNNKLEVNLVNQKGKTIRLIGGTSLDIGKTYDVAFSLYQVSTGSILRIYTRDVAADSAFVIDNERSDIRALNSSDSTVVLGIGANSETGEFIGQIDNFQIHRAPLNIDQITEVMNY